MAYDDRVASATLESPKQVPVIVFDSVQLKELEIFLPTFGTIDLLTVKTAYPSCHPNLRSSDATPLLVVKVPWARAHG